MVRFNDGLYFLGNYVAQHICELMDYEIKAYSLGKLRLGRLYYLVVVYVIMNIIIIIYYHWHGSKITPQ